MTGHLWALRATWSMSSSAWKIILLDCQLRVSFNERIQAMKPQRTFMMWMMKWNRIIHRHIADMLEFNSTDYWSKDWGQSDIFVFIFFKY